MPDPITRAAVDADMPAVRAVASHFDLLGKWPGTPDFLDAERTFGDLLVGSDGRAGIVGYGGTLRRGPVTHLGDLFVLPEHQSSGIGRMLLDALLPHGAPLVTFASADPRAMALYVRHGMRPRCPLLYLTGSPRSLDRPLAYGQPVERADARLAGELDAEVSGGDRSATLAWYAGLPGVTWGVVGDGYAFARVAGGELVVGPAGGVTPSDCAAAVLGACAAHSDVDVVRMAVPGAHPLLPALLAAGWRITDMDTFMTSDDALVRLDRYVPHPDLG
ncbi:GNAT family N-acetyltransferase [Planotetraspora sp. A-T 1434]|uniref:GNAT family N-acetyltransferase n=1 Tax=Planotetraspora sp. A-T 1434 TaxID=2979219 RepID=UPI0021C07D4D|nr:GNAT family N-acetyltransferase [Planotetraspora sp. A-T 1434]MCT9933254.1 GNAT family N-acetyltransferase [Planotetraspora sp. A-T 1434]